MRRLLLAAVLAASTAGTALAAPPHARLAVRATSLGAVLVDARGRTLYAYDRDVRSKSTCTGACAALWPPFLSDGKPVASKGIRAALVGTTRRGDGTLQVTFKGHPLYFFAKDAGAGRVAGAGIPHWAALTAVGARLHAASTSGTATTTPTTPVDPGGGGYGSYGP